MADEKPTEAPKGDSSSPPAQAAAPDALEKPEGGDTIDATDGGSPASGKAPAGKDVKKPGGLKVLLKRFNMYLLIFIFIAVVAGVISTVMYLNSRKTPKTPTVANQTLTPDTLKQLANSDATVGSTGQTLTIQGNAVVDGQMLIRGNLNIAGTIQVGAPLSVGNLTVSNTANLPATQINSLQVATSTNLQGAVTIKNGIDVSGTASFSGSIVASQITVTNLTLSGNAQLQVPNHVAFTGPSPSRVVHSGALGGGGSASVNGSDTSGSLNINTGSSPQPGCFVDITFSKPFAGTPRIVISAGSGAAAQTQYYTTRSKTGFSICTANAAPAFSELEYDWFAMD